MKNLIYELNTAAPKLSQYKKSIKSKHTNTYDNFINMYILKQFIDEILTYMIGNITRTFYVVTRMYLFEVIKIVCGNLLH